MADALPSELARLLGVADPAAFDAAWAAFVRTHSRLLLHVTRSIDRDHDAAMDAYAFVLEQLRRDNCHRLRGFAGGRDRKFTTWLVVVARRLCLDHHRQKYGRARDAEDGERESLAARKRLVDLVADEIDPAALTGPEGSDPESAVIVRERAAAIDAALCSIDARDRLLLKLRFEDDLSAREIAGVMGFPSAFHVYRRLAVLLPLLRASLGQHGVDGANP